MSIHFHPEIRTRRKPASARNAAFLAFLVAFALSLPRLQSPCGRLVAADLTLTGLTAKVLDNGAPGTFAEGAWKRSRKGRPFGQDADYCKNSGIYTFRPELPPGRYRISLIWTSGKLSRLVPVQIRAVDGIYASEIDQSSNGRSWWNLGEFDLDSSSTVELVATGSGQVCADAAKFELLTTAPTQPSPPAGLTATGDLQAIHLDWLDNSEAALVGYAVYRSESSGTAFSALATGVVASGYTDAQVEPGITYYYVVTALDAAGQESDASNEAAASLTDAPPAPPAGLQASPRDGAIDLTWNRSAESDLASYIIHRSTTSGSGYQLLASLPVAADSTELGAASSYRDAQVEPGITYYYVVTALDVAGHESDASNEAAASLTDTPPPPPAGLQASARDGAVDLTWNGSAEPDLAGYIVYRSTTSGSGYQLLARLPVATRFTDLDVANGTTYFYAVTALDQLGSESEFSAEVAATPRRTASPVTLYWEAPTTSEDGGPLEDLAGFLIYEGAQSGQYDQVIDVENATQFTFDSLLPGAHHFSVVAYDLAGNRSGFSNEIVVTVE